MPVLLLTVEKAYKSQKKKSDMRFTWPRHFRRFECCFYSALLVLIQWRISTRNNVSLDGWKDILETIFVKNLQQAWETFLENAVAWDSSTLGEPQE